MQPTATFQEDYTKSGGHLVRSAGLTGFRHLRYRGKGVEFAPDAAGPAHASIVYKLQHPFAPRTFDVRVNAAAAKGADVKLALSISGDGKQWSSPVALDSRGAATVNVPGNDPALQSEATWVRIDLDGRAERADETLLTIQSLLARETFAPTTPSAIQLKPDADGTVEYETRFDDLSWLHTASIDHPKALTVRPGGIGLAGQKGRSATASLVQEFVMDQSVNLQSLSIQAQANQPDLGAVIQLGVSLDGRKPLVQTATSGRFNKTLSLDAKELQSIGPAQRIYVHLTLTNRAGSKTAPAWIKGLKLEAKAQ